MRISVQCRALAFGGKSFRMTWTSSNRPDGYNILIKWFMINSCAFPLVPTLTGWPSVCSSRTVIVSQLFEDEASFPRRSAWDFRAFQFSFSFSSGALFFVLSVIPVPTCKPRSWIYAWSSWYFYQVSIFLTYFARCPQFLLLLIFLVYFLNL